MVKTEIDFHIRFVRSTAIKIIRNTFGFAEEANLQQSLLTWYDNLPEVAKNSIFSARANSLIEYIQAVDTGDADDIASKIVKKTTGMFIEDWKPNFEIKFEEALKEAVDEVLSKEEAVGPSQKILLISDDGTSVERFYDFNAESLSTTANFFKNALEDVMEEYDGILENNEKIRYRSNEHDFPRDFFIPVLKETVVYKRSVGYFSTSSLIDLSTGLFTMAERGGKVQLICSPQLSPEDIQAIDLGYKTREEVIIKGYNFYLISGALFPCLLPRKFCAVFWAENPCILFRQSYNSTKLNRKTLPALGR